MSSRVWHPLGSPSKVELNTPSLKLPGDLTDCKSEGLSSAVYSCPSFPSVDHPGFSLPFWFFSLSDCSCFISYALSFCFPLANTDIPPGSVLTPVLVSHSFLSKDDTESFIPAPDLCPQLSFHLPTLLVTIYT